jgi:hypothetical protein
METIETGSRVERIRGTTIEGLIGTVRYLAPSLNRPNVTTALVRLDDAEPGIGHQFVCDVDDLRVI